MPKAGDIIFSTDDLPWSVLIREHTNSPVSHVGMYIDHTQIISARASGVITDELDAWLPTYWIYRLKDVTDEQIKAMVEFMKAQSGDGYDYIALADFLVYRDLHTPGKWFCSELVTEAIMAARIPILGDQLDSYMISPGYLFSNPLLVEVKECPTK